MNQKIHFISYGNQKYNNAKVRIKNQAIETNWFDNIKIYEPNDLTQEFKDLINEKKIIISIIPDIESVNYGRGVGYEIIEHIPPTEIKEISATKIRKQLRDEGKL